jgi:hypothetical protein
MPNTEVTEMDARGWIMGALLIGGMVIYLIPTIWVVMKIR